MKIRRLSDKHENIDQEHEKLGIPPLEDAVHEEPKSLFKNSLVIVGGVALVVSIIYYLSYTYFPDIHEITNSILSVFTMRDFWNFALVGLGAQMIDGALGMAYGISSTTFLLSIGVPPVSASAAVHIAEIFTSGVSGFSHLKFGNVNKKLFRSLVFPGVIGGILGAFLSTIIDGDTLKPYISGYLLIMGIVILRKSFSKTNVKKNTKIIPLALFGGFVDAIGGGGWGPVVTTTLVGSGRDPRYTIGSVNAAEFFIAFFTAASFGIFMGLNEYNEIAKLATIIAGLVFGGLFAAPFAAYICRKVKAKYLMIIVGIVIILLSCRTLLKTMFDIKIF